MKKLFILTLVVTLAAGLTGYAEFLDVETRTVRTDLTYDPSFGSGGAWGAELGVGGSIFALDDLGVFGGYRTHADGILRNAGFYVEEHYVGSSPVIPFIGVGVGYGWLSDSRNNESQSAFTARFQTGIKYLLRENVAVAGNVLLSWAADDLYLTGTSKTDTSIGYSLGLRFYY